MMSWAMKTKRRAVVAAFMLTFAFAGPSIAVTPDEMLNDPVLESRARDISQHLRCVVCQNQSIDDSSAPLAHDLRVLVRDRLTAGDSNAQALNYIVDRYGNFVLLKPPFQFNTLLLWLGPLLFFVLAGYAFLRAVQRQDAAPVGEAATDLTPDERRRLKALMPNATNEGTNV
jgi:cytochrome c-type biogenesis protein CcmH